MEVTNHVGSPGEHHYPACPHSQVCPHCGHPKRPYVVYPVTPWYPWVQPWWPHTSTAPYTITYGTTTASQTST